MALDACSKAVNVVARQHLPSAAGLIDLAERIDDTPHAHGARGANGRVRMYIRRDHLPPGVGEISRITGWMGTTGDHRDLLPTSGQEEYHKQQLLNLMAYVRYTFVPPSLDGKRCVALTV